MPFELTAEQERSLDASRRVFNQLTGRRLTLRQFIAQVIAEAVESNARTAAEANKLMGANLQMNRAPRHVH